VRFRGGKSWALWPLGPTTTAPFFFAPLDATDRWITIEPRHKPRNRRQADPAQGPATMHSAAKLTMREWFSTYFKPWFLVRRSPKTITEYTCTLDRWEQLSANRPIKDVHAEHLMAWRARLVELHGRRSAQISNATANKHLAALLAILSKAGQPGPHNRDALGHLPRVPWIAPLRELEPSPRAIPPAELAAIYTACHQALHPAEPPASAWWQAFIVVAYTCALRRGAMLGITWPNVDLASATLRIPASIDKAHRERRKPLVPAAVKHLLRIRADVGPVFPWPHALETLNRDWIWIQARAAIAPEAHYTLHDLKRTAATEASNLASPWVVQRLLDHAQLSTSLRYVAVPPELRDLAERLPLPAAAIA